MLACGPSKSGDSLGGSTTTGDASESAGTTSTATTAPTTSTTTTTSDASTTSTSATPTTGEPAQPVPDPDFCPLDWSASTMVSGTTPSGPFVGVRAWFGWAACSAWFPSIYVFADPAEIGDAVASELEISRGLVVGIPRPDWDFSAPTGESEAWVFEVVDGDFGAGNISDGAVTVSLSVSMADTESPAAIPRIVGEFSLQTKDGEWDVAGAFDAAYCGPLPNWVPVSCD